MLSRLSTWATLRVVLQRTMLLRYCAVLRRGSRSHLRLHGEMGEAMISRTPECRVTSGDLLTEGGETPVPPDERCWRLCAATMTQAGTFRFFWQLDEPNPHPEADAFFEPTSDDEHYSDARALVEDLVSAAAPLLHERPITIRNLETMEHSINLAKSWLQRNPAP